jgi:hypothetical protein
MSGEPSAEYRSRQVKDSEFEATDGRGYHRRRSWSCGVGCWCRSGFRRSRIATTQPGRQPWRAARSWRAAAGQFPRPGRSRRARTSRTGRTRWSRRPRPGRTGWSRRPRTGWTRPVAWRRPARLLPRSSVGRRTRALGRWRATAASMGQAASAARWSVELRPDQLLGLPGKPVLESAVQPVGLRLLRGLDSAVNKPVTRRARFAQRRSGRSTYCNIPCGLITGLSALRTRDRCGRG